MLLGLHTLEWNPAILDGQIWSEFGEHGEHEKDDMEKMENIN